MWIDENKRLIYLAENKHSANSVIPSLEDIKDGLIKMVLFSNLKRIMVDGMEYKPLPVLKLTSNREIGLDNLRMEYLSKLKREAEENGFIVLFNGKNLRELL
ncbi:MAG: hypothetical protein ACK4VK_03125 [Aquificaceae bacterium]